MATKFKFNPLTSELDLIQELGETISLTELSDVTISSPSDNELLSYDSSSGEWINQTPSEAGLDSIYLKLDATNGPITGPLQLNSTLTIGSDGFGYDVTFYGSTSGSYLLWDESQDRLEFVNSDIVLASNPYGRLMWLGDNAEIGVSNGNGLELWSDVVGDGSTFGHFYGDWEVESSEASSGPSAIYFRTGTSPSEIRTHGIYSEGSDVVLNSQISGTGAWIIDGVLRMKTKLDIIDLKTNGGIMRFGDMEDVNNAGILTFGNNDNAQIGWHGSSGELRLSGTTIRAMNKFQVYDDVSVVLGTDLDVLFDFNSADGNVVLERNVGAPDFQIDMPIKVCGSIDEFSLIGSFPTSRNPTDSQDMLVVNKVLSQTSTHARAMNVIMETTNTVPRSKITNAINGWCDINGGGNLTDDSVGGGRMGGIIRTGADGATISQLNGNEAFYKWISNATATVHKLIGFYVNAFDVEDGTCGITGTPASGFMGNYVKNCLVDTGTLYNSYGLYLEKQTNAEEINAGIALEDLGNKIIFNVNNQQTEYIESTDTGHSDLYADVSVDINAPVLVLPVKTTTGDPAGQEGAMYVNTQDNALRLYADGAWRSVTTW